MSRWRKSLGLVNDFCCIADRDTGRQTLILARVSRHFLAGRRAEWRFNVDYAVGLRRHMIIKDLTLALPRCNRLLARINAEIALAQIAWQAERLKVLDHGVPASISSDDVVDVQWRASSRRAGSAMLAAKVVTVQHSPSEPQRWIARTAPPWLIGRYRSWR